MAQQDPHPVTQLAFACLSPGETGLVLLPPGAERLQGALWALVDSPDLEDAVIDLWAVADFLKEHHGSPEAATGILKVIQSLKQVLGGNATAARVITDAPSSAASVGQARRFIGLESRPARLSNKRDVGGQKWWQVAAG